MGAIWLEYKSFRCQGQASETVRSCRARIERAGLLGFRAKRKPQRDPIPFTNRPEQGLLNSTPPEAIRWRERKGRRHPRRTGRAVPGMPLVCSWFPRPGATAARAGHSEQSSLVLQTPKLALTDRVQPVEGVAPSRSPSSRRWTSLHDRPQAGPRLHRTGHRRNIPETRAQLRRSQWGCVPAFPIMAHSFAAASGQTCQNAVTLGRRAFFDGIADRAKGIDLDPAPDCGIVRIPSFCR